MSDYSRHLQRAPDDGDDYPHEQDGDQIDDHTAESKRRRIAKACDQCRRKKIRCNGELPCGNCSSYDTECHFTDTPKKRATPRGAKYIQSLESRLEKMESLLKQVLPAIELDDQGMEKAFEQAKPNPSPLYGSRQSTMSPDYDNIESQKSNLTRQSSQEQDEELAEEMGHLWHDADNVQDAHFSGPSSGITPLVSVRRTIRNLMGNSDFDTRVDGFRTRIQQQERLISSRFDTLMDASRAKRVEHFLSSIPKPEVCKLYVEAYFSIIHADFHVVSKTHFFNALDETTWQPKSTADVAFLGLYLMVLSLGSHVQSGDLLIGNTSENREGFALFSQARSLLFSSRDFSRLIVIQGTILIACYLERIGQLQELWVLVGFIVRAAQSIGLHRRIVHPGMDLDTQETRKRCWWLIYQFDSRLAMITGNPMAIQDFDCDQDLPTPAADEVTDPRSLKFKNGDPFNYNLACIQLAQLNHQIHTRLYSIQALNHLSQAQVFEVIGEIDARLLAFADTLPDEFKPGDGRALAQKNVVKSPEQETQNNWTAIRRQIQDSYLIPSLRLEYLQLVMLLHRRNMKPASLSGSPTENQRVDITISGVQKCPKHQQHNHRGSPQCATAEFKLSERLSRACSSSAIALQSARTIIAELCHRVPVMSSGSVHFLSRYSNAAALVLFSSIVRNPTSSSAQSDTDLLALLREAFLNHNEQFPTAELSAAQPTQYALLSKMMPDILTDLHKICILAIERAGTPRQKRSAGDVTPDSATQPSINTGFEIYNQYLFDAAMQGSSSGSAANQTASSLAPDYFGDNGNGLFNLSWSAGLDPYSQQGAGLGVNFGNGTPGLSGSGMPLLSPGAFLGTGGLATEFAALQRTPTGFLQQPAVLQQQQQQYAAGLQAQAMDGNEMLPEDYDAQSFWNVYGMYQQ